jgi:hypothetical protein
MENRCSSVNRYTAKFKPQFPIADRGLRIADRGSRIADLMNRDAREGILAATSAFGGIARRPPTSKVRSANVHRRDFKTAGFKSAQLLSKPKGSQQRWVRGFHRM